MGLTSLPANGWESLSIVRTMDQDLVHMVPSSDPRKCSPSMILVYDPRLFLALTAQQSIVAYLIDAKITNPKLVSHHGCTPMLEPCWNHESPYFR